MYETFTLKETKKGPVQGYRWPVENPKKVVCIVHGIGEYGGRYDRVATRFNEAGYAVVAIDLRGHGDSPEKKGHCAPRDIVLDDICEMLRYAADTWPEVPIILYGHSMGGNIGMEFRCRGALNDLPAGYIITGPWIRLVRPIPGWAFRIIRRLAKAVPSLVIGSSVDESILGNPECVLPYHDDPMVHNKISLQCAVEGYEAGLKLEEGTMEDDHRAADIPLLLMHGKEDLICDIQGTRKMADHLKNTAKDFTYIEWPGLYHEIHNGGPESKGDEVIDKMIEFIENCGRAE